MKKNKIITSVVVMALCSSAIAYATNKSGIIVFILIICAIGSALGW